jgi:hypothetical protein
MRNAKQTKQKTFTFKRPEIEQYSNKIKYIAKKGGLKAKMPVSHSLYRSILATMRDGYVLEDILEGNVAIKISGNLIACSDEQLNEYVVNFISDLTFTDK